MNTPRLYTLRLTHSDDNDTVHFNDSSTVAVACFMNTPRLYTLRPTYSSDNERFVCSLSLREIDLDRYRLVSIYCIGIVPP